MILTGAEHFAKAAEILAALESGSRAVTADHVPPAVGTAHRDDMLKRAAVHAQLAQAAAIVQYQPDGHRYYGYGEPDQ